MATAYSGAMNNPWSTLVESLSGTNRKTPVSWPARKVHRMMDDPPAGKPRHPATPPGPTSNGVSERNGQHTSGLPR